MRQIAVLIIVILGFSTGTVNGEEPRSIKLLLLGNSIKNPLFGCIYYRDEKTAEHFSNGIDYSYSWSVVEDRYVSGSNCGASGCNITVNGNSVVFDAIESEYSVTVELFKGNQCSTEAVSGLLQKYSTQTPNLQ